MLAVEYKLWKPFKLAALACTAMRSPLSKLNGLLPKIVIGILQVLAVTTDAKEPSQVVVYEDQVPEVLVCT